MPSVPTLSVPTLGDDLVLLRPLAEGDRSSAASAAASVLRDRCLERGRRVTGLMFGLLREEWAKP